MARAAFLKRRLTNSWPETKERSCSVSRNSRRPRGLGLDDLPLLLAHVLEGDGPVLLPALGREAVQVHQVEARGEGGHLGAARGPCRGGAGPWPRGSRRNWARTVSSGIGISTLTVLGLAEMRGLRSARFSVRRMTETSPRVNTGSWDQRLRVTKQ